MQFFRVFGIFEREIRKREEAWSSGPTVRTLSDGVYRVVQTATKE